MHGCVGAHELAIANEVRVEYLCYSGICESFGAFDGEMMDAIYTVQDSGSLPETQQMSFLFKTEKVVISVHSSMLVSSVSDAEQDC